MTLRPAHWAGTTIRSHRVPPAGHRATSRRSPLRFAPYVAASVGGLFLFFSVLVGFHLPAGPASWWEQPPPAGKLFPLEPATSGVPDDPAATEQGSVEAGDPQRASRGGTRSPSLPTEAATRDSPQLPAPSSPTAAAPTERPAVPSPLAVPATICPPPLPPTKKPKAPKEPQKPKVVLDLPTPSVADGGLAAGGDSNP